MHTSVSTCHRLHVCMYANICMYVNPEVTWVCMYSLSSEPLCCLCTALTSNEQCSEQFLPQLLVMTVETADYKFCFFVFDLHLQEVPRLRLGIDRPGSQSEVANYVLRAFSRTEEREVEEAVRTAMWTLLRHIEAHVLEQAGLVQQLQQSWCLCGGVVWMRPHHILWSACVCVVNEHHLTGTHSLIGWDWEAFWSPQRWVGLCLDRKMVT